MLNPKISKNLALGAGVTKSVQYAIQGALLPLVHKLSGTPQNRSFSDFRRDLKIAAPKIQKLLEVDSENISQNIYPLSVLFNELPHQHLGRIPFLIQDAFRANRQRQENKAHEFSAEAAPFMDEVPDYYRRNFHFQNGGYLSAESAELYDHQVEILFSGTAQAMRRQMIPLMKKHFQGSTGKGLKFLEIGSGTGSLTRAVALAFPDAEIVCLEPSPQYLQHAKQKLQDFERINFVRGFGENVDFKNETFHAVFTCYLFHELPKDVRQQVIAESQRVLKENGLFVVADSIQLDDDPELNWALEKFPVDFHEPFYKNYISTPMEKIISESFPKIITKEIHFLTKVLAVAK